MGTLPQLSIVKGPTRHLHPEFLHKLFETAASNNPNNTSLIFEDDAVVRKHTYQELDQITNKMARVIRKNILTRNLAPNSDGDYIVAVNICPNDHLVMVLLSIWKAGAAYLPLDHAFPGPRIEHIIRESKPVMVIYDKDSEYYLDTPKTSIDELFDKANDESSESIRDKSLQHLKDDLAIVLYTSGSTGVPKGVRLPHKVILNRLQWQFKTFPYSSTEVNCIFKTALTFVDSVSEIWGPIISGLTLVVLPKEVTKDPERLVYVLDKFKIQRLVLVPTLLKSLLMYLGLQRNSGLLESLKLWVCSGESLPVSLAEEFFKYFGKNNYKLCNFYGSTEVMGDVTYHVLSGSQEVAYLDKIPIGLPVDNTIIYLLDSDFRPVKAGDVGELFVSGLNLAAGYVNGRDPEKFVSNPLSIDPMFSKLYRTGDFARIEKGVIIYEGRTDSQIKIRGHRVDLTEIEKALNSMSEINKAVVLCYKPGEMNQALVAFVTSQANVNENQIEAALRKKLTSYMIPQVILVENIPLLVNGKIDRQTLLKNYENKNNDQCYQVDIDYKGVLPNQMEAAKVLFETVASVLNRSARSCISVDANFYEIGGNSLNSIYTISKLSASGYQISIGDFIAAIDLGEVLERMTSTTNIKTQPPRYTSELLKDEHKKDVQDIITSSFYNKADLEQWLIDDLFESDYAQIIDAVWEPLLEQNLSIIVRNEAGKIVGTALNFDARDEPEAEITSKLTVILEFLDSIEGPVRDTQLPSGKGKILHAFMMGTHSSLSTRENVAVIKYMEDEVLRIATERKFAGVFTTNTSPLTQQLGTDVYGYQTLLDYQVNQYVAPDNTKPFGLAPDEQRALVQWKPVN